MENLPKRDVKLALKIDRLVRNQCKDVPNDIGITIEQLVRQHQSELKSCSIPDVVGRSEQLPHNPITDKEYKELINALYQKDNSKRFRR